MRRRTALSALASAGFLSVPGCAENSSISGTPEPADLFISSLEASTEKTEALEQITLEFTVENLGDESGEGSIVYEFGPDWNSITVELEGGKAETYTATHTAAPSGESIELEFDEGQMVSIGGTHRSVSVEVTPVYLQFGEPWQNPEGYTITISEPEFIENYQAQDGPPGEVETVSPDNGDVFAFVPVSVENDRNGTSVPVPESFFARSNSEEHELSTDMIERPDFQGEFSDTEVFTGGEIQNGSTRSGLLIFEIGGNEMSDFQVGWGSRTLPDHTVYWTDG